MRGPLALVLAVALCVVGVGACAGSDDATSATGKGDSKASAGSETTADPGATTSPNGDPEPTTAVTTPTTVSDDEFEERADSLNASIDKAGDDPCKILGVLEDQTPAPVTPAQTEDAIGVFVNLFSKLAAAAPPSVADSAAVVRNLVEKLPASAKAVGYDPEKVSSLPELSSPEIATAIGAIRDAAKCSS